MNITPVGIKPTKALLEGGYPSLTPELLAACGARYSRNNEGLKSIVERIDPTNEDGSVESIFRMIDYGHQSIADLVPIAIFIDGISQWLALEIWNQCPTASGQESSTRYIKMAAENTLDAAFLGSVSEDRRDKIFASVGDLYKSYFSVLSFWQNEAEKHPELVRIPSALSVSKSDADRKKFVRLVRNFAFDRARYLLPLASLTNLMLIMSARGWVQLIRYLLSLPQLEANMLGERLRIAIGLFTPRLTKHATREVAAVNTMADDFSMLVQQSKDVALIQGKHAPFGVFLEILNGTFHITEESLSQAIMHRENRYSYAGAGVNRIMVRFGWTGLSIGDLRDLNRHRTGSKFFNFIPRGVYLADDTDEPFLNEMPLTYQRSRQNNPIIIRARNVAEEASKLALNALQNGDPCFMYSLPFGAQCYFEHTTTLKHFLYEAELRTGLGAHFSYANRMSDCFEILKKKYPKMCSQIKLGNAEPE